MIEDDFYCTIKLKHSGEEIFAKVAASEEEDRTMLIVSNPVSSIIISATQRVAFPQVEDIEPSEFQNFKLVWTSSLSDLYIKTN